MSTRLSKQDDPVSRNPNQRPMNIRKLLSVTQCSVDPYRDRSVSSRPLYPNTPVWNRDKPSNELPQVESIRQNTHRQRGIGLDSSFMGRVHRVSGSGATMMDLMVYWLRKQC